MAVQQFGLTWWGQQWVASLERLGATWENRLPRGRTYARKGTVHDLRLDRGEVSALVDGSRPRPYLAEMFLPAFSDEVWDQVVTALARQLRHAAALLDGRMPEDVDDTLAEVGVSLFPQSGELETECSCPDWANPCKHIAAVHYVLAARFDDDPFLLFELRGRSRDQVLDALRAERAGGEVAPEVEAPTSILISEVQAAELFGGPTPTVTIHPDPDHDPLATLHRLGPLPSGNDAAHLDVQEAILAGAAAAWALLRDEA